MDHHEMYPVPIGLSFELAGAAWSIWKKTRGISEKVMIAIG